MPQASGFTTSTYNPDRLIAGNPGLLQTRSITLLTGQDLARGAVIGQQSVATVPTTGTADGGNTGNGTMGSVAVGGVDLKPGTYTMRCVKVVTDKGDFEVIDPDGLLVGIAITAVAFTSSHLDFTIADGSTDHAIGDEFTVLVATVDKYLSSLLAAEDGSQRPVAVLAEDCDASGGDAVCNAYFAGEFDENELTFGTGQTIALVRDALHTLGIRLMPSITP